MENIVEFLKSRKIRGTEFSLVKEQFKTTLSFRPDTSTHLANVQKAAKDISLYLSSVGIVEVTPLYQEGKIQLSWLHTTIASMPLPLRPGFYSVPLGLTTEGKHRNIYLPKAPHILVAGTTGSGKTYWMNGAIKWALRQEMNVIAVDPKWGEFAQYKGSANFTHLTSDTEVIKSVIDLAARMDNRYQIMAKACATDILKMNESPEKKLDPIVFLIDELADIIGKFGNSFLQPLQRIAQKGRAAGIHVICATQAPTAKLLNGELKANFPVRVSFRTASAVASRVILDSSGAEALSGAGDGICVTESGDRIRFRGYTILKDTIDICPKSIWKTIQERRQ